MPSSNTPIRCTVCGALLKPGAVVICEHCGSELHFENPPDGGPAVKRGSTPAGRRVIELVVERFMKSNGINLAGDPPALQRIVEASERAAREIEEKGRTVVNIPFVAMGASGPVNLEIKLTQVDIG